MVDTTQTASQMADKLPAEDSFHFFFSCASLLPQSTLLANDSREAVDTTDKASVSKFMSNVGRSFNGQLHALVNCVGINPPQKHLLHLDEELFDKIINVNLKSTMLVN